MAPTDPNGGGHILLTRDLAVRSDAQKVTIGLIIAYVVVIALLWNLPYVRMVLWPFKVSPNLALDFPILPQIHSPKI